VLAIVNKLTVTGDQAEFARLLSEITGYMKSQPGFRNHRLYHSLKDPNVYIETGEWDSKEDHQKALSGSGFQERVGQLLKHATADVDFLVPVGSPVAAK
jgi:heme-degrading monooxygenase HmoA